MVSARRIVAGGPGTGHTAVFAGATLCGGRKWGGVVLHSVVVGWSGDGEGGAILCGGRKWGGVVLYSVVMGWSGDGEGVVTLCVGGVEW